MRIIESKKSSDNSDKFRSIQVFENQIRSDSGRRKSDQVRFRSRKKKPEPDLKKSGNHFQVQVKGTLTCSEPYS